MAPFSLRRVAALAVICFALACSSKREPPTQPHTTPRKPHHTFTCSPSPRTLPCSIQHTFHSIAQRQHRLSTVWTRFPFHTLPIYLVEMDPNAPKTPTKGYLIHPPTHTNNLPTHETSGLSAMRFDDAIHEAYTQSNGLFLNEYTLRLSKDVTLRPMVMILDPHLIDAHTRGDHEWPDTLVHESFHKYQNRTRSGALADTPQHPIQNFPINQNIIQLSILEIQLLEEALQHKAPAKIRSSLRTFLAVRATKNELDPSGVLRDTANLRELLEGTARYIELATRPQPPWDQPTFTQAMYRNLAGLYTKDAITEYFARALWYESGALLVALLKRLDPQQTEIACERGVPLSTQTHNALASPMQPDTLQTLLHKAQNHPKWPSIQAHAQRLASRLSTHDNHAQD